MVEVCGKTEFIKLILLKKGQNAIVADLDTKDSNIIRKLMSMGILPGVTVRVIQTYPSYVFQAGYTQVAVDKEIASAIVVSPL